MIVVIRQIYVEITKNIAYFIFSPYFLQYRFQFIIECPDIISRWTI